MKARLPKISNAEWDVMALLWQHKGLGLAQLVLELGRRRQWSPRTIRTLLDRLIAKRCVKRRWADGRPVYVAAFAREDGLRHASRSFLDRVFGGEPAAMLVHLVKATPLSANEIQELKRILDEKEP